MSGAYLTEEKMNQLRAMMEAFKREVCERLDIPEDALFEPFEHISAGYGLPPRFQMSEAGPIIAICGHHGDFTVAECQRILDEFRGVILIDEPPQPRNKSDVVKLLAMFSGEAIKVENMPKPVEWPVDDFEFRQRDYPTLRQSLRNPHFKKKHRR